VELHSTQPLKVAVLTEDRDFEALEEEWKDLYQNAPLATPFQAWAWLYSWWESYGEQYELRLITLRNGDLLVGLMPLMLERRWGFFGKLLFIGTGPSDYLDILVREGWAARVMEAGVNALHRIDSWQVADLQELHPEAAAWGVFREWSGPRTRIWQSGCPVIDVRPWDELLATLSLKQRSNVRRTIRRAEKDGVVCELAGVDDAEQAACRFVGLHREMWRERGIASEHLTEKFESHMVAAASRMTDGELAGVFEFWREGEVIASHLLVFGRGFVAEILFGAKQEAVRRYQVSSLNVWNALNVARRSNRARVNLLRGEEPYKLSWASAVVPNYRMILTRDPAFGKLFLAYRSLRSKASQYANSESTPQWIKSATNRFRGR
jgi:CelD/BcsL family acetyltransferase involved in cellulose biosynthesis